MAWMSFWARSYAISSAVWAALEHESRMMLTVLERMSSETDLQIRLITEPLLEGGYKNEDGWQETMNRLRAYSAWCLWSEKKLLEEMTDPRTLRKAYDTRTAREVLSDPELRKFFEEFHCGGREVYRTAQEGERVEAEAVMKKQLRSIMDLLEDPTLASWTNRLAGSRYNTSFWGMFDEETQTVCARLSELGLRFGYASYMQGSMAIHGGSVNEFLSETTDKSWFPRIVELDKRWREKAMTIAHDIEDVYICLMMMKSKVWKIEH
jgi:hypothetical protein